LILGLKGLNSNFHSFVCSIRGCLFLKNTFERRIRGLLSEKAGLLSEKEALVSEKAGLLSEKEALVSGKEALVLQKEALVL